MKKRYVKAKLVRDLCSGPGKLCLSMDITKKQNGADMTGEELYIENGGGPFETAAEKRINIDYAGEARDFLWRFRLIESVKDGVKA